MRAHKLNLTWRGKQDVRAANVRALSDSLVLTCHRDDFQTHLGRLTDIRRLWRFEALRKVRVPVFLLLLSRCWLALH